jgi:xanthine dehydrogenase small subunit
MNSGQHTISFILDDEIVTIDFKQEKLSPTLTILNYLRSLPNHKGAKEGCAEGDCGACTVVVADLDEENKLVYRAINSCLVFLPILHGKQLITVENLAKKNGRDIDLHPVQQALVDMNGSQCGYCTPGIVMSMFALYKSSMNPSSEVIKDAMTGNLCRCTGYQPILNATELACSKNEPDQFSKNQNDIISKLKEIKSQKLTVQIITKTQKYFLPQTLADALALRKKFPKTIMVNGSTDIALKQTKKFERLKEIIDLSVIRELKCFSENKKEIILGSGLSLEAIKTKVSEKLPALGNMLSVFASKQIRNVATLGGNLGTASPIGDTIPLLIAYDSKIRLVKETSFREIPIEEFIKGHRETDLRNNELIHSVIIPLHQEHVVRFYKVSKRRDLDISTVSAGFRLEIINGTVSDICLAFGGMADRPKRAVLTEASLFQKVWNAENIEMAANILENEFSPISDARSGSGFRKMAAKNLLLKFYHETL